ncbi:hypothetical protein PMAYCL1PPCAC_06291, partial [Pristionchus mayeri]
EIALKFIHQFDSKRIQIISDEDCLQLDFLRRVAETKEWIVATARGNMREFIGNIETPPALIPFIVDIYNGKCCILDLTDAVFIDHIDTQWIVKHFVTLEKKAYFPASTNYPNNIEFSVLLPKTYVKMRPRKKSAIRMVEIRHADMDTYAIDRHL